MDELTRGRLQDILDVADELAGHLRGRDRAAFAADRGLQRIAERLLEIAGEAANHVPDEIAKGIEADWRNLRGMRVLLAHAYRRIAVDRLWNAATIALPRFAAAVAASLR